MYKYRILGERRTARAVWDGDEKCADDGAARIDQIELLEIDNRPP